MQQQDQPYSHHKQQVNVDTTERVISAGAGLWLLYDSIANRDLGSIAKALAGGYLLYRGVTGHCYAYDLLDKRRLPDPVKNMNIRTSIIVNKPRQEVYDFWRKLENLPLFMQHLESVAPLDDNNSLWKAKIPGGLGTVEWEAAIVKDRPGEFLGWSSLPGADIENAGKVEFRDAGHWGTELYAVITYRPPLRSISTAVAKLFNPAFEDMVKNDIENFKRYIETGGVPTAEGETSGRA